MARQFTTLAKEQERMLSAQLKHMNTQLTKLNEKISNLMFERDRLEMHMKYCARELHCLKAAAVKQDYLEGKRV